MIRDNGGTTLQYCVALKIVIAKIILYNITLKG